MFSIDQKSKIFLFFCCMDKEKEEILLTGRPDLLFYHSTIMSYFSER